MSSTILYKDYGTVLERDSHGRYFLRVLCGTIGMFELTISLTPDEIERYQEWGDYFIQKLALDVSSDPAAFRPREVEQA